MDNLTRNHTQNFYFLRNEWLLTNVWPIETTFKTEPWLHHHRIINRMGSFSYSTVTGKYFFCQNDRKPNMQEFDHSGIHHSLSHGRDDCRWGFYKQRVASTLWKESVANWACDRKGAKSCPYNDSVQALARKQVDVFPVYLSFGIWWLGMCDS